ncbi:response regulator transcription factor [Streptomyces cyaneofuscatus]|uniref:response regulator n=1 Tax=Streptomyces TaxID=1883 RepID=UPI00036DE3D5|nr:response regulator [Streptomyces sp. ScaeMP-e10]
MTVRVVLADDQTVVRAGFRALLDLTDDLVVVAEAADGVQAVEAVRLTRPDVVLMDIRMPGVDGLEATRRIAGDRSLDGVRVVMLTTYQVDAYVFEALRHGAAGFLLKDIEPDDLRAAIRTVAEGRSLLAPAVTRRVIEEFARLKAAGAVTTVIGVLLLPSLFGPLFGNAERWIAGLSPTAALEKLTQTSDATADTVGSLGPWPSLLLVTACTTALALAALVLLRRRDA